MKKTLALGIGVVALGGCALPVPLQVASWALDGISYLATDKSMTDHGLSIVAQQDCALLRGVTEGSVCRDWDDAATLVADADTMPMPQVTAPTARIGYASGTRSDIPPLNTDIGGAMPNVEVLANFDTAAGPAEAAPAVPARVTRPLARIPAKPKTLAAKLQPRKAVPLLALPVTATVKLPAATSVPMATPTTAVRLAATTRTEPLAGVYYVIGSFRNYANAHDFASHYENLVPDVLAAKLDGAPVYRVVVGPVSEGRERQIYRRVAGVGLKDSWAIRVVPGDWLLARQVIKRKQRIGIGQELARATQ